MRSRVRLLSTRALSKVDAVHISKPALRQIGRTKRAVSGLPEMARSIRTCGWVKQICGTPGQSHREVEVLSQQASFRDPLRNASLQVV